MAAVAFVHNKGVKVFVAETLRLLQCNSKCFTIMWARLKGLNADDDVTAWQAGYGYFRAKFIFLVGFALSNTLYVWFMQAVNFVLIGLFLLQQPLHNFYGGAVGVNDPALNELPS